MKASMCVCKGVVTMKRSMTYAMVTLVLVIAILLQPLAPALRFKPTASSWVKLAGVTALQAQGAKAAPQQLDDSSSIFLPLLSAPPGPPEFVITSPVADSQIAGTVFFSIQPHTPGAITHVEFQASSIDLGM